MLKSVLVGLAAVLACQGPAAALGLDPTAKELAGWNEVCTANSGRWGGVEALAGITPEQSFANCMAFWEREHRLKTEEALATMRGAGRPRSGGGGIYVRSHTRCRMSGCFAVRSHFRSR